MELSSLSPISKIFTILIIILIYIIIFTIVKIMYKDIKVPNRRQKSLSKYGLEIIKINDKSNFKVGGVIPINDILTIGRKNDNVIILSDDYVSLYHAKIYLKNGKCLIKDLSSTNGTFVNKQKIKGKVYLNPYDTVQIGKNIFKVIG